MLILMLFSTTQTKTAAIKLVTVEFAGIKILKGLCTSDRKYLEFAEIIIGKTVKPFSNMSELIICEEKYPHTITPDHVNVPLGYKESPRRLPVNPSDRNSLNFK